MRYRLHIARAAKKNWLDPDARRVVPVQYVDRRLTLAHVEFQRGTTRKMARHLKTRRGLGYVATLALISKHALPILEGTLFVPKLTIRAIRADRSIPALERLAAA